MAVSHAFSRWLEHCDLRIPPRPMTKVVRIALCGVVIFGIAMRVHGLDRSFWLDEVWVANAIMAHTIPEMVYYEGWLNPSPPLFLLLVRFVTQLFGVSHASMRLVPSLFGIISMLAMAYLALRLLKPWYALVAVLLLALSPDHVVLSQSVKQYTADVFVALVLLILGYQYLRTRSQKVFYAAVIIFGVGGFLSYQAIVFLPVFFYAACVDSREINGLGDWRAAVSVRWLDVIVLISVTCIVSAINYFYFISPNIAPAVVAGFAQDFYHRAGVFDSLRYFLAALANLTHPLSSLMRSNFLLRVGALAVILAGVVGFGFRREARPVARWEIMALLVLPILSLVVLNWLGKYPIAREPRIVLFIFPVITILFASGAQFAIELCALTARRMKRTGVIAAKVENALAPSVFVGIVCLFIAKLVFTDLSPHFQLHSAEEALAAMRYLSEQHVDGDVLYIHSTMGEHYKFYSKIAPIRGGRVVEGDIGISCCRRRPVNNGQMSPAEVLAAEFARLDLSSENRNVRLLFSGRQFLQKIVDRNRHEFSIQLADKGCIRVKETAFRGIRIDEYTCEPSSSTRVVHTRVRSTARVP